MNRSVLLCWDVFATSAEICIMDWLGVVCRVLWMHYKEMSNISAIANLSIPISDRKRQQREWYCVCMWLPQNRLGFLCDWFYLWDDHCALCRMSQRLHVWFPSRLLECVGMGQHATDVVRNPVRYHISIAVCIAVSKTCVEKEKSVIISVMEFTPSTFFCLQGVISGATPVGSSWQQFLPLTNWKSPKHSEHKRQADVFKASTPVHAHLAF